MRKTLIYLFALITILSSAGCETTKGAGRDIEKAGEGIQDAAN